MAHRLWPLNRRPAKAGAPLAAASMYRSCSRLIRLRRATVSRLEASRSEDHDWKLTRDIGRPLENNGAPALAGEPRPALAGEPRPAKAGAPFAAASTYRSCRSRAAGGIGRAHVR